MLGLSTLNRTDFVEDEEGEAALVDSFFLPGGILDPDVNEGERELQREILPRRLSFADKTEPSAVPSNPWESHSDGPTLRAIDAFMTQEHTPQHYRFGSPLNASLQGSMIPPPPGYEQYDRPQVGFINNNEISASSMGEVLQMNSSRHRLPVETSQERESSNPSLVDGRITTASYDRAIQRPGQLIDNILDAGQAQHLPWESDLQSQLPIPKSVADTTLEFRDSPGALEKRLMGVSSVEFLPDLAPQIADHEANISEGEEECEEDNDEEGDDDEEDEEQEEVDAEDVNRFSIPLELLSIRGIYKGDSITSSLSTSTCDSDCEEQNENHTETLLNSDQNLEDELGDVVDHVSHDLIVKQGVGCEELESAIPDASDKETSAILLQYKEGSCGVDYQVRVQGTIGDTEALSIPRVETDSTAGIRRVQGERVAEEIQALKSLLAAWIFISSQTRGVLILLNNNSEWLWEAKELLTNWTATLVTSMRVVLVTVTKALILLASFMFQVWKYSLIEAVEETNVTICYALFYFMPGFCSLLMDTVNLPHWTPHLIASAAVFSLCNQVKPGPLHAEYDAIFQLRLDANNGDPPQGKVNKGIQPSSKEPSLQTPRDERACRTILQILRYVLPIFFLTDGFSSEFGTIMGVSGASRLTTAFMMSLVRKNLVSSPIGWMSWAIQVLFATYYRASSMLDQVVLVVGLSSIRLIRYLEGKRQKANNFNLKQS